MSVPLVTVINVWSKCVEEDKRVQKHRVSYQKRTK